MNTSEKIGDKPAWLNSRILQLILSEYFSEIKTDLDLKGKGIKCRQYQEYQEVYKRTLEDILGVIYETLKMRKKLGRESG